MSNNMIDVSTLTEALTNSMIAAGLGQKQVSAPQYKHTIGTPTPTTNLMHGGTGIFGVQGIDRDVFSTRVHPTGLLNALPALATQDTNPVVPYLTGFTSPSGTNPDGVCDDPRVAGQMKSGMLTAIFGRISGMTEDLNTTVIGEHLNRGEFFDLRVIGDPILDSGFGVPEFSNSTGTQAIAQEVLSRLLTLGIFFELELSQMLWTGNPLNNTANGGWLEFPGLDILIGTGKVDAISGTLLPSLDSDVKDYNYNLVDTTSPTIVEVLSALYRTLRKNARTMGMNPTTWAIVMREELFWEISAVWPTLYDTWKAVLINTNSRLVVDAKAEVNERDRLRSEQILVIDGVEVPVIFDDGIVEENGDAGDANFNSNLLDGSQFASNIYFVPLTVAGGMPVTFMEYFNFAGQNGAMEGIGLGKLTEEFWTDGGKFIWTKQRTNWCVNWLSLIRPRVRLLTPHLAGRLDNVAYQPYQHTRQPFNENPYFTNGGDTSRTSPSFQTEWDLA